MRVLAVVGVLVGVGLLLSPSSTPPLGTICAWARPRPGEAWYGPALLTTAQAISVLDELKQKPYERWCRLVAAVSLHFGDYEKVFTEAFPILQRYGVPATAFIVTGRIGQPGYMTLEQITELAKNNWEIGSHSVTHQPLVGVQLSEIRAELEDSKAFLEGQGFRVFGFLSPLGLYDELVLSEIRRVYSCHRSNVFSAINVLPPAEQGVGSRWELVYFQVKQDTPPQEVIIKIDQVNRRGGWLILDFHDMGDYDPSISYPPEALEQIVRFIRADLRLCTLEELQGGRCQARW